MNRFALLHIVKNDIIKDLTLKIQLEIKLENLSPLKKITIHSSTVIEINLCPCQLYKTAVLRHNIIKDTDSVLSFIK